MKLIKAMIRRSLFFMFLLVLTGCSSNGISHLKQMDADFSKQMVMIDAEER